MRPPAVVEGQIPADRSARVGHTGVGAQVNLLVCHRFPDALDEDVVAPGALAVHADPDARADQQGGEVAAGELRALIRIEDIRLAERAGQKIVLQRQLPDLRMKRLHVDQGGGSLRLRLGPEYAGGPVKELAAPLRDLVGVDIELLRQIGQRLLAHDGRQRDLRLESRAVVPAHTSRHIRSCSRQSCRVQAENPPIPAVQISRARSELQLQVVRFLAG